MPVLSAADRQEVFRWAHAPARATDPAAALVRGLLADFEALMVEAARLADFGPRYEQMRMDLEILRSHCAAYRRDNARLRGLPLGDDPDPDPFGG